MITIWWWLCGQRDGLSKWHRLICPKTVKSLAKTKKLEKIVQNYIIFSLPDISAFKINYIIKILSFTWEKTGHRQRFSLWSRLSLTVSLEATVICQLLYDICLWNLSHLDKPSLRPHNHHQINQSGLGLALR